MFDSTAVWLGEEGFSTVWEFIKPPPNDYLVISFRYGAKITVKYFYTEYQESSLRAS
jgi:hypothetical protein